MNDRLGDRRIRRRGAAVLAAAVILLGSGCASGSDRAHPVRASASTPPANDAPAEGLCRLLLTVQDLPQGFSSAFPSVPCEDNPRILGTSFRGRNGGLETLDEQLHREASAEQATAEFPGLIGELNKPMDNPEEQDTTAFRDLGDEVKYYTAHFGNTSWSKLYIRRGKLLIHLSVTQSGPFTATDMHVLASKAVKRAEALG